MVRAQWLRISDIDADGFRILERARHLHPSVRSVLMEGATLASFRDLVGPAEARPVATTSRLTAIGR